MRPVLTFALVVVVSALCACNGRSDAATRKPAPPPREVEVLTLEPTLVRDTGEYLGSLISRQSVNVLPQVSGYVRRILVKPGDRVEAGAVLVEIDSREEEAALESAQANLHSSGARLELAKQTLTRTQALYQEGLVSAQELERARADLQSADAAAKAATAAVSQRKVQLQYHDVRAPFAGVVGDVLVRLGDYVNANTQLTSIAQAEVLELSVAIPAPRAREVTTQTPVELLDSAGNVLQRSQVFFVAPQADPRTQLVEVKAIFSNTLGLRPSEWIRTRLVYSTRQALQVPALAVIRQSGQPFVFRVTEENSQTIVERYPVELGPLGDNAWVVERGLSPGDRIAISGLQALRDGMAIVSKPVTFDFGGAPAERSAQDAGN
ncbi:MAG: efflux RND transporter periplasmic adaptor subunit [Myxococcaceae bacterium]|nr:efflux RND transporter periplasmic adaptor subunit [Myxococcaceae bacterium]